MARTGALLALLLALAGPVCAQTKAERAEKLLDAERFAEGLALAEVAAKEADDSDAEAPGIYGRALFELKRFKEAKVQLEKARVNGWDKFGRSYLARIAWYYNDRERAKELLAGMKPDHWLRRSLTGLMNPTGMRRTEIKHYKGTSTGVQFPSQGTLILRTGADSRKGTRHGFSDKGIRTLFHEAFHQFIDKYTPECPDWLNEGMAEYFETAVMAGKNKLDIGIPQPSRTQDLRDSFAGRDARTYPMRDFLKISYTAFHQDSRENLNYSQGWGIVHFLLHGPVKKKGRKALKDYFTKLREGASATEAHDASFGKLNLNKLEAAWKAYINRL